VVAAMSSMSVKPEISGKGRKGRKGRLVIGDWGTDDSRPAFPGRAVARKGRKAPTRAPTGSGQVRGVDAGREGNDF